MTYGQTNKMSPPGGANEILEVMNKQFLYNKGGKSMETPVKNKQYGGKETKSEYRHPYRLSSVDGVA